MEEFPASNLTYWDVSQQTYLYVQTLLASSVSSKGDIHPFNGGGGGREGKEVQDK